MSSKVDDIACVGIPATRTALNVVYYQIDTEFSSGKKSKVFSRFREFDELNKRIRSDYRTNHKHLVDNLPDFPSKTVMPWTNKESNEFIETRKNALQSYLQKLITIPFASENKHLNEFLTKTVLDNNEYDEVFNLNKKKESSSSSVGSLESSANETKSVSSSSPTNNSTGVFFSVGYSSGTHPATISNSAASSKPKPPPPTTAPPAVSTDSSPSSPSSSSSASENDSSEAKEIGEAKLTEANATSSSGGRLSGMIGGLFGKKKPETKNVDTLGDDKL